MLQLYCSVGALDVTFTWRKDGEPVVIDVPHLRERTCDDVTTNTATSVLTIDNFQSSDNGTYQCTTMTQGDGNNVTLIGI